MKSMKTKLDGWEQDFVIHCPNMKCSGMLLNHPEYHEFKCGVCNKFFLESTKWFEVKR